MFTTSSFSNFNDKTSIKATAVPSTTSNMVSKVNELDISYLNMMVSTKNNFSDISCSVKNSKLEPHKIKCNYPKNQNAPSSSIIAYKCTNNIPENLSTLTTNNSLDFNTKYIPRGGWARYNIDPTNTATQSLRNNVLKSPSPTPYASNLVVPITNRQSINVTDKDGNPLYVFNSNSTSNYTTWTKIEDLCIKD